MATIKSFTSLEQSKKLAEILPIESADMCYPKDAFECDYAKEPVCHYSGIGLAHPCWSLSALLGVLPDELGDNHFLILYKEGNEYCCCYEDTNGNSFRHTFTDNPVDACVAMVKELNELNLL